MQTYVVRVYRRDSEQSDQIVGVIEEIETGQVWKFRSLDELCSVFCGQWSRHKSLQQSEFTSEENGG